MKKKQQKQKQKKTNIKLKGEVTPEWIGDAYKQKKKWFIDNHPMGERICRMFGL